MPSRKATARVGMLCRSRPSSTTEPPDGFSSRARPRSSVDLPHAFGPAITVIRAGGMRTVRLRTTACAP
jgi:hypothetical protein